MTNVAILIGNSEYSSLRTLDCCKADVQAMKELLEATEKYAGVYTVEDSTADAIKVKVRQLIEESSPTDELFLYFSGHGYQHESDFYLCATDFDSRKPNATGLSTDELHTLLRLADADLVVKVIDACNSGTLLIKAESPFQFHDKQGFKNIIQISSCREDQYSATGEPLSLFTEKFRTAALRKTEGAVYYTDIVNSLRDAFIQNDDQTPFFVSQFTGRESFVDDAHRLDALRDQITADVPVAAETEPDKEEPSVPPRSLQEVLAIAEEKSATREVIDTFTTSFLDTLKGKVLTDEFSEFFEIDVVEHSNFEEPTTDEFITRVMSRENRMDEFVTASVKRERSRNPLSMMGTSMWLGLFGDDERYREVYDLRLNCEMKTAQVRFAMTPKFNSLRKVMLVVTCAPSLHRCYIFELGTQQKLSDFQKYESEGDEVIRRWYKLEWTDDTAGVANKISSRLHEIVRQQLEAIQKRLLEGDK